MSELKPCPFCGEEPELMGGGETSEEGTCWWARCHTCGCSQGVYLLDDSGSEAVEAWNRRAQPAQVGQVLTLDEVRESVHEAGLDWHNGWTMGEDAENRYLNLCRAIEAAVLAKRVPQWLPISTAPKGQRVMVWIADKEAGENIAFATVWFHADGTLGGGAEGFNGQWDLTHWAPLPPPPIVGKEGA